jgi:hypothetical protein
MDILLNYICSHYNCSICDLTRQWYGKAPSNGAIPFGVPVLENDEAGVHRFNSYFCDPYNSSQKAECESNHRICRYGQGKGESVDRVSDQEILDLFSKVNSYPRESLGWLSTFQTFRKAFFEMHS